jgi:hypothetical protein
MREEKSLLTPEPYFNVPPLKVIVPVEPRALESFMTRVPELRDEPPEKELLPLSAKVPEPVIARAPVPEICPVAVRLPAPDIVSVPLLRIPPE